MRKRFNTTSFGKTPQGNYEKIFYPCKIRKNWYIYLITANFLIVLSPFFIMISPACDLKSSVTMIWTRYKPGAITWKYSLLYSKTHHHCHHHDRFYEPDLHVRCICGCHTGLVYLITWSYPFLPYTAYSVPQYDMDWEPPG